MMKTKEPSHCYKHVMFCISICYKMLTLAVSIFEIKKQIIFCEKQVPAVYIKGFHIAKTRTDCNNLKYRDQMLRQMYMKYI